MKKYSDKKKSNSCKGELSLLMTLCKDMKRRRDCVRDLSYGNDEQKHLEIWCPVVEFVMKSIEKMNR